MYQVNIELLESKLIKHFNPATALTLACRAADSLAETQAWVEIDEMEFSRRVGSYFSEGEHMYTVGPHQFKSKQLFSGGHKFFIYLTSKPGTPLKGWFKRYMYRIKRDMMITQEQGNVLFNCINELIRDDLQLTRRRVERPVQQHYMQPHTNLYQQGWQTHG